MAKEIIIHPRMLSRMFGTSRTGITKKQLANDPNYAKVRNNAAEFGCAGKAVKLLREAFATEIKEIKDPRITSRLQKLMLQVVKSDQLNRHGERRAEHGDLWLLEGFEFNASAALINSLGVEPVPAINRAKGTVSLSVPGFIPTQKLLLPRNCTHYEWILAAAEIDFEAGSYNRVTCGSGLTPVSAEPAAAVMLHVNVTSKSALPVFMVAGIRYSEVINGAVIPMQCTSNVLCLLKVDML